MDDEKPKLLLIEEHRKKRRTSSNAEMVKRLREIADQVEADESDALALCITVSYEDKFGSVYLGNEAHVLASLEALKFRVLGGWE